eukprot:7313781-Prorocentrum_lima.AAC.1
MAGQMGAWKRTKCLGVKDLEGNDLTSKCPDEYIYLNTCVVSMGQIAAIPPNVARRDVRTEAHY